MLVIRGSKAADDSTPGLDMREVPGPEHGLDHRSGISSVACLGGRHGKEAEGVGIEAAELPLIAEAGEDGLGAREAFTGVLVR